jgi:predicted 3-demethylubiquinone-9 3-methyltransferase (glyoxalase superfamily)
MQKIVTCLGFNDQAEAAVKFYTSVIPNSKILSMTRHGDSGPGPKDALLAASFELNGQEFMALNGGPSFTFAVGTSIMIKCDTQAEVDALWDKLSEGGRQVQCGWVTDKFGLSWQIVPRILPELLSDPNPKKSQSVMRAMLQMQKLDIAQLQAAHENA